MRGAILPKIRCAIYTRKSSEEGLEQDFNSLDAQRASCESHIESQKSEGWLCLKERYDDGGISGGTLDRPALRRLVADIEEGCIDVVVVHKIDRLSRSLADFSKLVEIFDRFNVTFVSVTQSFNTTNSMGRLTLNILLSFAQFERELTGERIREKIALSRQRGIWMGGAVPLGYFVKDRKLIIQRTEAATVTKVFERFTQLGSATKLAKELWADGSRTRSGKAIDKGIIYKLLNNKVYLGLAVHKGASYPGQHDEIISQDLWDQVHAILQTSPRQRAANTRRQTPALLKGLIFGSDGVAMSPTHTHRRGKFYQYYVSQTVLKSGANNSPISRIPAAVVENQVITQMRRLLQTPEVIVAAWQQARRHLKKLTESEVREALHEFDLFWNELFPAEQTRIVQLLVQRVEVDLKGLRVRLRTDGLGSLVGELSKPARNAT